MSETADFPAATKQPAEPKDHTVEDHVVIRAEHDEIARRRGLRGMAEDTKGVPVKSLGDALLNSKRAYSGAYDTNGLCLSGGGIRSAAFSTGVMQAMARHEVFEKLDYLSTVSGGGYTGITTSIASAKGKPFPFFERDKDGNKKGDKKKDTPAMSAMRNNANYLKAGQFWEMLANLLIYLRGIAANILIVAPWLLLLAAMTLAFNPTYDDLNQPDFLGIPVPKLFDYFTLTVASLAILIVVLIAWSIGSTQLQMAGVKDRRARYATYGLLALGLVALFEFQTFVVIKMVGKPTQGVVAQCPVSELKLQCLDAEPGKQSLCLQDKMAFACAPATTVYDTRLTSGVARLMTNLVAVLTSLSALFTLLSSVLGKYFKEEASQGGFGGTVRAFFQARLLWWLVAAALPATLWLCYLLLVYAGVRLRGLEGWTGSPRAHVWSYMDTLTSVLPDWDRAAAIVYLVPGVILLLLSLRLTANGNSPHRLYRDRLGKAFCFSMERDAATGREEPKDYSDMPVSALGGNGPYHLINTALNIAGDAEVNKRGRNADFFLISPLYVGSRATGYVKTADFEKNGRKGELDVATAVAVSGAALAANMGSSTVQILRLTLAFFNVRLGYWFTNPKWLQDSSLKKIRLYFLNEILGRLNAKSSIVYLSDGGHIENLGLYELLRRRCQLIIVVDGEADPEMTFGSFTAAQRYARIDLGAKISMKWSGISAQSLATQKLEGKAAAGPHCAIGTIEYEGDGRGYIVYVKSSVTGDENDYVRDYNRRYLAFPHQDTGDQFFSEEQFEAYRALGYHAMDGLLSGSHGFQNNKGEIEYLTDVNAKGDGVADVARILGIAQKVREVPPVDPTIHRIKLV